MATKNNTVDSEKEALKQEVSELKDMVFALMNELKGRKVETVKPAEPTDDFDYVDEIVQINPTQLINITSLYYGGLNLLGAHGKPIRLERFGMTIPITFEDLTHICSNNRRFAEEGFLFIHNENAIKLLYLTEYYKNIVNHKTIASIIKLSVDEIDNILKSTTRELKNTISDIIVNGIKNNEPSYSDRNKIDALSKILGKDLEKCAKQLKEYDLQK